MNIGLETISYVLTTKAWKIYLSDGNNGIFKRLTFLGDHIAHEDLIVDRPKTYTINYKFQPIMYSPSYMSNTNYNGLGCALVRHSDLATAALAYDVLATWTTAAKYQYPQYVRMYENGSCTLGNQNANAYNMIWNNDFVFNVAKDSSDGVKYLKHNNLRLIPSTGFEYVAQQFSAFNDVVSLNYDATGYDILFQVFLYTNIGSYGSYLWHFALGGGF